MDCFLEQLNGIGCWYTGLQTCLWSVHVRFSELNVAQLLHLRPGWKDYSVSIFINPGPFPSPCSQLPWEAFIYKGLSLTTLHYIFIFNCLLQLTDPVCAFNTQCSTLMALNGRKQKQKCSCLPLDAGEIIWHIKSMVCMQMTFENANPLSKIKWNFYWYFINVRSFKLQSVTELDN